MRFRLALFIGKLLWALARFSGRGTNLTGAIALKIDPNLLSHFSFSGKIIAVTGSNGKTSTANLVRHILEQNQKSVAGNFEGSNLTGGVATALIKASSMKGHISSDFVVLETDERYSRLIFKHFTPHYMLVTNLFRDQVTRNGNVDVISDILNEAIPAETVLVLNANDPISSRLCPGNERVTYGLARTSLSSDRPASITHDAKACPNCLSPLHYSYFHYNHIGAYSCPSCGFAMPEPDFLAYDVDHDGGSFYINGEPVTALYKNIFNILNVTGAVAACCTAGIELGAVTKAASTFVISPLRYNSFDIKGRTGYMILSKNQNPVSFDQSISYLLGDEGEKTVIAYINNINHTNHKDTTWLWDIGFERLLGHVSTVICAGPRALDLAVRLRVAGFAPEQLKIYTDLQDLSEAIADTRGSLYILTELYDARRIMEVA